MKSGKGDETPLTKKCDIIRNMNCARKVIIAIVILFAVCAPLAASVSSDGMAVNVSIGLLSGPGVSYDTGRWQFGVDLTSTFPVYCVVQGITGEIYENFSFWEGFRLGILYFIGADVYSYYRIAGDDGVRLYAGLDLMMGTETPVKSFESVLRPTMKVSFPLGEKTGMFVAGGISLLDFLYVPGFEKPLVRVPDVNYASVLTGCRVGMSFALN